MNPIHQIGRYRLPLFNITSIETRGRLRLRHPLCPYAASLTNGRTIYFTKKEKAIYDDALLGHARIVQTLGMAKAFGLQG